MLNETQIEQLKDFAKIIDIIDGLDNKVSRKMEDIIYEEIKEWPLTQNFEKNKSVQDY